mmetsp:Transcript_13242/g.30579  ORF Transcript_13242/g.30579 Transcript_13242/m.30579 type:complete len:101 (+) Transcript_13242:67-369(+)
MKAKSQSDLNYAHSAISSSGSRIQSDDESLGDDGLFDLDPLSPVPKKQFLEAAFRAKSQSDMSFVHASNSQSGSRIQNDNESLGDDAVFSNHEASPFPKK